MPDPIRYLPKTSNGKRKVTIKTLLKTTISQNNSNKGTEKDCKSGMKVCDWAG